MKMLQREIQVEDEEDSIFMEMEEVKMDNTEVALHQLMMREEEI